MRFFTHLRSPRRLASSGLLVAVVALGDGCGPSFQAVYNGERRFEHCYALEEDARVSIDAKRECWKEWVQKYTYAQTRDRVEYAASRYRALSRLPELPTDEALMAGAPGEGERSKVALPAPTNAFAPPATTIVDSCREACTKDRIACERTCASADCTTCKPREQQCVAKCAK